MSTTIKNYHLTKLTELILKQMASIVPPIVDGVYSVYGPSLRFHYTERRANVGTSVCNSKPHKYDGRDGLDRITLRCGQIGKDYCLCIEYRTNYVRLFLVQEASLEEP
ncbi:hypothetical protein Trydic_g3835 [Trypoxylus dichotomus]